jgi:hypothetical protein
MANSKWFYFCWCHKTWMSLPVNEISRIVMFDNDTAFDVCTVDYVVALIRFVSLAMADIEKLFIRVCIRSP